MTKLLQISDPHLLSRPDDKLRGVTVAQSLQQLLQKARQEVVDPARVVFSGDLSQDHALAGYQLLKDLLEDWSDRSLLIPGNHDDRSGIRQVFHQVPGQADEDIWFRDEIGDWQLIGLDSQVTGEGRGELSQQTLERLQAWLSETPGRPTLIFLHHHLMSVQSEWLDRIGLSNSESLEKLLRSHEGVRGIFCGHIHQVFEGTFAGVPFYSSPSASFQFVPQTEQIRFDLLPPGFRVIELQGGDFRTRVVRLDTIPFVPLDQ
ncbi:MAG: hypothetical protein CMJ81_01405 [Planctomycetaceae bacterium]|jgi:Icc protein|nr:hypothetical protein [Planctomycetaceae bacterium]